MHAVMGNGVRDDGAMEGVQVECCTRQLEAETEQRHMLNARASWRGCAVVSGDLGWDEVQEVLVVPMLELELEAV